MKMSQRHSSPVPHGKSRKSRQVSLTNAQPVADRQCLGHNSLVAFQDIRTLAAFRYPTALQPGEIRLLKLKSSRRGSTLDCALETKATGHVSYIALSYAWGSPIRDQCMICNGQRLDITSSLHLMLSRLQESYGGVKSNTYIWTDAICINQDDSQEKTAQVRRMAAIYREASQVIVWLGEEDNTTATGIDLLSRLCTAFPSANGETIHDLFLDMEELPNPESDVLPSLNLPDTDASEWQAAAKLLDATWYARRWILQEVANAKDCCFRIGSREVSSEIILGGAYRIMMFHQFKHVLNEQQRNNANCAGEIVQLLRADQSPYRHEALTDHLIETAAFASSDPRDRIFATLGCLQRHNLDYLVDYTKPLPQVLLDVALCEKDPSELKLSLLRGFCQIDEPSRDADSPSWVPNWHFSTPHFAPLYDFHESDGTDVDQSNIVVSKDRKSLSTGAIIFDTVEELGQLWEFQDGLPYAWQHAEIQEQNFVAALRNRCALLMQCQKLSERAYQRLPSKNNTLSEYDDYLNKHLHSYLFGGHVEDTDLATTYQGYLRHAALWFAREDVKTSANNAGNLLTLYQQHCHTLGVSDSKSSAFTLDMAGTLQYHSELTALAARWSDLESEGRYARRFFTSKGGKIGWAPQTAQPGDAVCVFFGFATPFVVRKVQSKRTTRLSNNMYRLVGACYVHGYMEGEVFMDDSLPRKTVQLV